ncbi:MAG: hypothetical protein WD877_00605 [Candidatus Saccharimonadales bacterium]
MPRPSQSVGWGVKKPTETVRKISQLYSLYTSTPKNAVFLTELAHTLNTNQPQPAFISAQPQTASAPKVDRTYPPKPTASTITTKLKPFIFYYFKTSPFDIYFKQRKN